MFGQAKVNNHRIDVSLFNENFSSIWCHDLYRGLQFPRPWLQLLDRIEIKHIIRVIGFKVDLFKGIEIETGCFVAFFPMKTSTGMRK